MADPGDARQQAAGALREVRHTHHSGFRSGEWARILTVAPAPDGTDCYVVRFPDGVTDFWRVVDPDEPYEFRDAL